MKILMAFLLVGVIFVIEYDGYYFNPCNGSGNCFAIDGYEVAGDKVFCDSLECVENKLYETGIDHINKIYRIEYSESDATIRKVKIKFKATLE